MSSMDKAVVPHGSEAKNKMTPEEQMERLVPSPSCFLTHVRIACCGPHVSTPQRAVHWHVMSNDYCSSSTCSNSAVSNAYDCVVHDLQ